MPSSADPITPVPHTNSLIHEASPYLLQHAHNPVDWLPWGDAAFQKARSEDKPIFLSVGYAACHWCHVMERESFEDDSIAKYLNEHFVSIKVDREERPDVDRHYMEVVQRLSGGGGWPMSVFLTPDAKAFYGGTYWPPTSKYGRSGFMDVLRAIHDAWTNRRADVLNSADAIHDSISSQLSGDSGNLSERLLSGAVEHAVLEFDSVHGGFGTAPKFPHSMQLVLLLCVAGRNRDAAGLHAALHSLRMMARGGMFDQVGGGFHRYSTDVKWLVPHFEKMLYDNALLVPAYLDAFCLTGEVEFLETASATLDWALREMSLPEGGFASSLDADAGGEEGLFYVWTLTQIQDVLGPDRGSRFARIYQISDAGNFEGGTSIPNLVGSLSDWADQLMIEPELLRAELDVDRRMLLAERERRTRPARDDKVLTDWNGLMITALVQGFAVSGDARYLTAAQSMAARILDEFDRTGMLPHSMLGERVQNTQFLLDHAALGCGLLDLFAADGKPKWYSAAKKLAQRIEALFACENSLHVMSAEAVAGVDGIDFYDNATPSGIAMTVCLNARLFQLTGNSLYEDRARSLGELLVTWMERAPSAFGQSLIGVNMLLNPPAEIVLAGDNSRGMWKITARIPAHTANTLWLDPTVNYDKETPDLSELLSGRVAMNGKPTAYVCRNFICDLPITSTPALQRSLAEWIDASRAP